MACFLVSAAEAAVVTVAAKAIEKKERSAEEARIKACGNTEAPADKSEILASRNTAKTAAHIPFSRKLKWLSNMLWGGSVLLLFEHLWHGEIVPWFPFLTAAQDPKDAAEMLKEMSTVGVAMAVLVTAAWLVMVGVSVLIEKKAISEEPHTVPSEE